MNLSSVTTTALAPMQSNLVLRLRAPSLEERENNLLRRLQESSLLTEEEREALEKGRARLTRDPARSWTYILVHVVYKAIVRDVECVHGELSDLQDAFEDILREKLPEGTDVEGYVQEFEKMELEFRLIYEKMAAIERASFQEIDSLYAEEENIRRRFVEDAAATSRAVIQLQQERLGQVEELAERMNGLTAKMLEESEKTSKMVKECNALGDKASQDRACLSGVISHVEDVLNGVL